MSWNCLNTEERLTDYLDGVLTADLAQQLSAHLGTCVRCRELIASVRATLHAMQRLEEVPEPPELAEKILVATLGPRKKPRQWPGWLAWVQPILQPRIAMGLATASLAVFFTLNALGVDFRRIEAKDFHPVNLYYQADRKIHLIYARSVKYVNDLRVVYEIQSMLQPANQEEPRENKQPSKTSEKPNRESNQLLTPRIKTPLLAIVVGSASGGNAK